MTPAQIKWLKEHPDYEPVGVSGVTQTGGTAQIGHRRRGTLNPDGTFVAATKATPVHSHGGSFIVGVRAVPEMRKF